jgi:hypothetical protein
VAANAVAGTWALGAHRWPALRRRALWWFTAAAEVTIFVQAFLGAVMVSGQQVPAPPFHVFYGFFALFTVAVMAGYRQQLARYLYLLYGLGGLFLMGLALRAIYVQR